MELMGEDQFTMSIVHDATLPSLPSSPSLLSPLLTGVRGYKPREKNLELKMLRYQMLT